MFRKCGRLARKTRRSLLPGAGLLALLLAGFLVPATEQIASAITQPSITNPGANEAWLMGAPYTVSCSAATDAEANGPISYTWTSESGTFPSGNVGQSIGYVCKSGSGSDTLKVTAADTAGNATSNPVNLTIAGLTVIQVGFGGGNTALCQTPSGANAYNVWDDSTATITNPVWSISSSNNAATNYACFVMGTTSATLTSVVCQASATLTQGATFSLSASSSTNWASTTFSISSGSSQSAAGTLSLASSSSLLNSIQQYTCNCNWQYCCTAGSNVQAALNSTSHTIFLTFGTPNGGVVTVKRIAQVCSDASGDTTAAAAAASLWSVMNPMFNVHGTPGVTLTTQQLIWESGYGSPGPSGKSGLDCNGVSLAFQAALNMLGVPNTGSVVFLYPVPGGTVQENGAQVTRNLAYTGGQMAAGNYNFTYIYVDGAGDENNYESCFKVSIGGAAAQYYAPGTVTNGGVWNTAQTALGACVASTRWYLGAHYWPDDASKDRLWSENP